MTGTPGNTHTAHYTDYIVPGYILLLIADARAAPTITISLLLLQPPRVERPVSQSRSLCASYRREVRVKATAAAARVGVGRGTKPGNLDLAAGSSSSSI